MRHTSINSIRSSAWSNFNTCKIYFFIYFFNFPVIITIIFVFSWNFIFIYWNINFNFYLDSIISLLIMSVFSTALATVIYYKIIHDYGPSFLSLVNYPIPIFAFFIGVVFLKESANILSIISLFLIIASIYLSQKKY